MYEQLPIIFWSVSSLLRTWYKKSIYREASFRVCILLSLSDGRVGMILRRFVKASLRDCVRWRSRTFAITRWFCRSSKLCGGDSPFRRVLGPEQCPFKDPSSLASECSSSLDPAPRLWRRFLPWMYRCFSTSFPFMRHSWCSDPECLVIPTTENWLSVWLMSLLLHRESPGSIFMAPGTIVNLAGNAVGVALLNAAVVLGAGGDDELVQSVIPVDKVPKLGPIYPVPSWHAANCLFCICSESEEKRGKFRLSSKMSKKLLLLVFRHVLVCLMSLLHSAIQVTTDNSDWRTVYYVITNVLP